MILAEILGPDLLILLAIAALLFGSSRLPKLARSLGSAKAEFEKGIREGETGEAAAPAADEQVTMTRAELDALITDARTEGDTLPPT